MRLVKYSVAASLDGFIAGPNGEYDWIIMDPAIDFAALHDTEPLTPAEQLATFHLPTGFEIQLFAAEPAIQKPMNMAFDAQARAWKEDVADEAPQAKEKKQDDSPTGDPEALYDSLFGRLLKLDRATRVFPAHDYKGNTESTIGAEIDTNPRLQKSGREEFVAMMRELNLAAPTHLTEALRTNMSGGVTVEQLLLEAAHTVPFMSLAELQGQLANGANDLIVLDVREREAFENGHIPGARHLARGQLELRVNDVFPDPTIRILTCCEFGKISTLAAATLRQLGFMRAVALDGGVRAWREAGFAVEAGQ